MGARKRWGITSWEESQSVLRFLLSVSLHFIFIWYWNICRFKRFADSTGLLSHRHENFVFVPRLWELNILRANRQIREEKKKKTWLMVKEAKKFSLFLELSRLIRRGRSAGSLPSPLSPSDPPPSSSTPQISEVATTIRALYFYWRCQSYWPFLWQMIYFSMERNRDKVFLVFLK